METTTPSKADNSQEFVFLATYSGTVDLKTVQIFLWKTNHYDTSKPIKGMHTQYECQIASKN
jgi:hypothetical protein